MRTTRKNKTIKKGRNKGGALLDYFRWKTGIVQRQDIPDYYILYNNNKINCEICGNNKFAHIDVSVNRSKVLNVVTGDDGTIMDHPLTVYRCKKCNNCKFIYRTFGSSDNERPIQEILVSDYKQQAPPPQQQPQPQPPAPPAK